MSHLATAVAHRTSDPDGIFVIHSTRPASLFFYSISCLFLAFQCWHAGVGRHVLTYVRVQTVLVSSRFIFLPFAYSLETIPLYNTADLKNKRKNWRKKKETREKRRKKEKKRGSWLWPGYGSDNDRHLSLGSVRWTSCPPLLAKERTVRT